MAATFLFLLGVGALYHPFDQPVKDLLLVPPQTSFHHQQKRRLGALVDRCEWYRQRASGRRDTPAATNPRPRAFAAFLREVMASGVRRQRSWPDEG